MIYSIRNFFFFCTLVILTLASSNASTNCLFIGTVTESGISSVKVGDKAYFVTKINQKSSYTTVWVDYPNWNKQWNNAVVETQTALGNGAISSFAIKSDPGLVINRMHAITEEKNHTCLSIPSYSVVPNGTPKLAAVMVEANAPDMSPACDDKFMNCPAVTSMVSPSGEMTFFFAGNVQVYASIDAVYPWSW